MNFFSVNALSAGYGKSPVLRDISFDLHGGCLLGILGANGSGKTTLLKAICGILPHTGSCTLDGMQLESLSVRKRAQLCSYIPQRSGISIDISALDVVLMGFNPHLKLLEQPGSAMRERAIAALAQVGLSEKAHENYLHLSEGQKQLCILARTLVSDSKLLLLDEPESALDFHYRYRMLDLLRLWVNENSTAAVASLHDPSLALNYCDHLLLLSRGTVAGMLSPKTDSPAAMERQLSELYGPVSLQQLTTRSGQSRLVMLREDEA